jgi:hypothetical protein
VPAAELSGPRGLPSRVRAIIDREKAKRQNARVLCLGRISAADREIQRIDQLTLAAAATCRS